MVYDVWAIVSAVSLLVFCVRIHLFLHDFRLLKNVSVDSRAGWPRVSLIVPACNEGPTIGPALQSLLDMDYPNLELIVVEDRSEDSTNAVIRSLQAADPRLQLVEVKTLPPGWLGKVHALHQGVLHAGGEWLLFSDADVHYEKDSLKKALIYTEKYALDFLTVAPGLRAHSALLRFFLAGFIQFAFLGINLRKVRDSKFRDCVGGGAFSLIRREVYDRSRGLEWLKLDVIDDTGLAMVAKQAGARCDMVGGLGEIELEWYPSAGAYVRGLEKNAFAIFQYSWALLLAFMILATSLFFGLTLAPLMSANPAVVIFEGVALAVYFVYSALGFKKLLPFSPWIALTLPFSIVMSPLVALRSAVIFWRQGGIYWRGAFYAKEDLIAQQRFKLFGHP